MQRVSKAAWQGIEQQLGLGAADFITARVYADEQTLALCAVCATTLNLEPSDFFEEFGEFWVGFAASGPYRGVMKATGSSLPEFITNLDRMHGTIRAAMPDAQTPLFELVEHADDSLLVRYRSPRQGLEPLVKGLLLGLIGFFGDKGTVDQLPSQPGHTDFRISMAGAI